MPSIQFHMNNKIQSVGLYLLKATLHFYRHSIALFAFKNESKFLKPADVTKKTAP